MPFAYSLKNFSIFVKVYLHPCHPWPGLTLRLEAKSCLMNKTASLCGSFDGISTNERIGRNGLQKTTLAEMAASWNEDDDCKPEDIPDPSVKCDEVQC